VGDQVRICKRALPALLKLNMDPISSLEVQTLSSGILHNLSRNPTNTTAFYKVPHTRAACPPPAHMSLAHRPRTTHTLRGNLPSPGSGSGATLGGTDQPWQPMYALQSRRAFMYSHSCVSMR
jgi:hypothetical protein